MVEIGENGPAQGEGDAHRGRVCKVGAGSKRLGPAWALAVALICILLHPGPAGANEPSSPSGLQEDANHVEEVQGTSTKDPSAAAASTPHDGTIGSTDETELDVRPAQRQRQVERNLESVRRNIWWNRPRVINNLKLDEEQRRILDGLLENYLRTVLQAEIDTEASLAFHQALAAGELGSARGHLETIGAEAQERGMAEGEMMLQVLDRLSPEQLEILRQRHGLLLQRSWVKWVSSSRGRTGGQPGSHGARGGSGSGQSSAGGG